MVWVREGDRRYHLLHGCPYLRDAPGAREDESARHERENVARDRGLRRCHHCYGSASKAV